MIKLITLCGLLFWGLSVATPSWADTASGSGGPATPPAPPTACASDDECGALTQFCKITTTNGATTGECVRRTAENLNRDPGGLVPCTTNCNFCDLFTLVERVVQKIFLEIVPVVATLLVAVAGILMLTSGGENGRISKAWEMLRNVVIGLAIMYSSWIVVHGVLTVLIDRNTSSVADIIFPWNDIECKIGTGVSDMGNNQSTHTGAPAGS